MGDGAEGVGEGGLTEGDRMVVSVAVSVGAVDAVAVRVWLSVKEGTELLV